jgi:glycosyltransferase involved in cell wall biosynthesis
VTIAICFGQFGPYHHARVVALQDAAHREGIRVLPVQIAGSTATYEWKDGNESRVKGKKCDGLKTLCAGIEEAASPLDVFLKARRLFRQEKVDVAFLPSYSPARYFALFAAAKSLGIRTVMMNESHAGTEQATGWKRWIKRQIVKRFDAAFVGGEPHKRHFASLGIPAEKIFTGYDAVDNALFAAKADEVRSMEHGAGSMERERPEVAVEQSRQASVSVGLEQACLEDSAGSSRTEQQSFRSAYGLPERYFLSLGRMVEKKNLATLIAAYARYAQGVAVAGEKLKVKGHDVEKQAPVALVFVGSGELENALREQARGLGLRVVDCTAAGSQSSGVSRQEGTAANCKLQTEHSAENDRGAVFFYGFRQIEENAVFYALAEAFVLPSLKEEWGLVVNEAMAAGLPVIVSRTAGCAEDLLPEATASRSMEHGAGSMESGGSKTADDCKLTTGGSLEERSNGFAFDPRSSDALSEALRRIADPLNPKRSTLNAAAMGRRSREIVAKFGCENFAQQAMRAACAARGGGCESYW